MENQSEQKDKLEFHTIFLAFKNNIKIITYWAITAFILGIFIVVFTPKRYKTEVSLLAESRSGGAASGLLGQLGGISGLGISNLMGIDMSYGSKTSLTPDLYPEVVKSSTFLIDILQQEVFLPKEKAVITIGEYLKNHTKPSISGWPFYIIHRIKGKSELNEELPKKEVGEPLKITPSYSSLIKSLSNAIRLNIIKSDGVLNSGDSKIITLSVELQNPYISALLAEKIVTSLQKYVIEYNTNKVKTDLDFIEARYAEAKSRYYQTQQELANFDDSHINLVLASTKSARDKLVTENNLASGLYNALAQKREQAKILVQNQTPVFTVLEPATIPIKKSNPNTLFTLIGLTFIGIFVAVCFILWKEFIFSISRQAE